MFIIVISDDKIESNTANREAKVRSIGESREPRLDGNIVKNTSRRGDSRGLVRLQGQPGQALEPDARRPARRLRLQQHARMVRGA